MQYKNNILYTDLKEVTFDFPIKQVVKYRGMFIVLISPLDNLEYPSNVFGVNNEGDIMWKIKSFNGEAIIFHSIEINLDNGKLYLKDLNHFKYIVDSETGEIISGKIRPLEDEETPSKKENFPKITQKFSINGFLENKKIIYVILIIFGFLILNIFSKNIKINSLEKKITEQQNLITTLENTLVKQEQTVSEYEQVINAIKSSPQILQALENPTTTENNSNTTTSSSTNTNIIDGIQTEEAPPTTETKQNTTKDDINNGVSTVIDFIDSVVGNVSSGTPTTIDDVNNSQDKISDGYIVSEIIDGQRIKVSKSGEEDFIVKLISVSECSSETLRKIIPSGTQIYLENDSKKYNDSGEMLAYVWVTEPNSDNLNSMVNYAILKNNLGKFVNESPNIKYNRYFF